MDDERESYAKAAREWEETRLAEENAELGKKVEGQCPKCGREMDSQVSTCNCGQGVATSPQQTEGGIGLVIYCVVKFFVIGIVFGFAAHLVFPWMIGNMQHAIQTKSFVWNAEQAASDTTFVMKIMISIIQRSTFEIGIWVALVLGLPFAWFVSRSQTSVSKSETQPAKPADCDTLDATTRPTSRMILNGRECVSFSCPECDERISFPSKYSGMMERCPECNERIMIPELS